MKLHFSFLLLVPAGLAKQYYFDASASSTGDGSTSSPFKHLGAIQNLDLQPGDDVLLKRGSSFTSPLILNQNQSGAPDSPITIQAYGDAGHGKPSVTAGDQLNAVLLQGTSHVILQDIAITNPGDNKLPRRGVYIYAMDSGEMKDITLQRLYIHDVRGYMPSTTDTGISTGKYANASGGIVFEAAGNRTATFFTDVTVQDNEIRSVDRQGIYTWTNWCRRPAMATFWRELCFQPWHASTGYLVQRNRLYDVGGDGIVVHGHEDAVVRNNTVFGFNMRSDSPNAGIWTGNSDGTLFQYNVVSGGNTTVDGMSFDVDHSTSGTLYEYNVSHDNEGGFLLLCPYDKPTRNFTVRYNLSVNDRTRGIQICDGELVGGQIYKNTIFFGEGISPYIVTAVTNASLDVLFADNIVRKEGSGTAQWELTSDAFNVTNNAFHGSIDAFPPATNNITSAPGLAAPGLRDPKAYLLLSGSAALDSAVDIPDDASEDFFSNPTAAHTNLGFYAGGGTKVPAWISNFDTSDLSQWPTQGAVAITSDPARGHGKSVRMKPQGSISRQMNVETPFRFNARIWLEGSASEKPASIQIGHITASFSPSTTYLTGEWQILGVLVSGDSVEATLDGQPFPVSSSSQTDDRVAFASGETVMYVDDVFVTPL